MTTTKLHINLNQGLIDVEGDEAFVRSVYEDFKKVLTTNRTAPSDPEPVEEVSSEPSVEQPARTTGKRSKRTPRKPSERTDSRPGWSLYKPQLDNNLNTASLSDFFARANPKTHAEKILTFVRFLEDELNIRPCSADQIYTCYRVLRTPMPEAFVQALRDTQNKKSFIEANSPTDISATIVGNNHFERDPAKS